MLSALLVLWFAALALSTVLFVVTVCLQALVRRFRELRRAVPVHRELVADVVRSRAA